LRGPNGAGKTSLLEAITWLATMRSFRGSPRETMVRVGESSAVVRSEVRCGERDVLIESEINVSGRSHIQVNRQPVRKRSELAEVLRVTVFSPDDLHVVQSGPQWRREYLDDLLASVDPRNETLIAQVERILRQRSALLRQAGGGMPAEIAGTLDVWDERLADAGAELVELRENLVRDLGPVISGYYDRLAGYEGEVVLRYRRSWEGELGDALAKGREDDVRRNATGVGPHRDDLEISMGGKPSRTHASQGEQRSLALAFRLAAHDRVLGLGTGPPVLLLDDVFSELDVARSSALVALLPPGQVLLTTATGPPPAVSADRVLDIVEGEVIERAPN